MKKMKKKPWEYGTATRLGKENTLRLNTLVVPHPRDKDLVLCWKREADQSDWEFKNAELNIEGAKRKIEMLKNTLRESRDSTINMVICNVTYSKNWINFLCAQQIKNIYKIKIKKLTKLTIRKNNDGA